MSNPRHVDRRRRRRWLIAGSAFAAVVLLGLAVFVLPTYAARWFLQSTLEDAGLQATGVETVEIDHVDIRAQSDFQRAAIGEAEELSVAPGLPGDDALDFWPGDVELGKRTGCHAVSLGPRRALRQWPSGRATRLWTPTSSGPIRRLMTRPFVRIIIRIIGPAL